MMAGAGSRLLDIWIYFEFPIPEITNIIKSNHINKYSFVHIATHGFINEEKPRFSGIIFTDKGNSLKEDGVLYSSEIFNLNLKAELVVLSA